jgi:hypothetical protein
MAQGSIFVIVTSSASQETIGAINGIAQTCSSIVKAFGPAAVTALYALSVDTGLYGGYGVFWVMGSVAACGVAGSWFL